jgi:hypothetical protein
MRRFAAYSGTVEHVMESGSQNAQVVPAIYSPVFGPNRLNGWWRLVAAAAGAACLTVLILAASIRPSTAGVGSHHQLKMARCGMLERTGIPCPTCGMTTSYAWLVRGNVAASLYVQPMGTFFGLVTAMGVWVGFYIALTGVPALRALRPITQVNWVVPLVGAIILAWAWKIFIHVRGIDGWG